MLRPDPGCFPLSPHSLHFLIPYFVFYIPQSLPTSCLAGASRHTPHSLFPYLLISSSGFVSPHLLISQSPHVVSLYLPICFFCFPISSSLLHCVPLSPHHVLIFKLAFSIPQSAFQTPQCLLISASPCLIFSVIA